MKVRYKDSHEERNTNRFNPCGVSEIDMYDDSAFIKDLDVEIDGEWKDMGEAFDDKDIVPDNYNQFFGVPESEEARERGYNS